MAQRNPWRRRRLGATEVAGLILLSAGLHLSAVWAYQNWMPDSLATGSPSHSGQAVTVTLMAPEPQPKEPDPEQKVQEPTHPDGTPESRRHVRMQHKPLPKPAPTPEVHQKPQPVSQPTPKPEPTHETQKKPRSKPETVPKPEPKPKPKPKPAKHEPSQATSQPEPATSSKASNTPDPHEPERTTPAVSGLHLLDNRPPRYPRRAIRRRLEGTVKLRILVTARGTAGQVSIIQSSGHAILDNAAIRTVRKWHFKPATRGGKPIPGYALQTIRFRLPG